MDAVEADVILAGLRYAKIILPNVTSLTFDLSNYRYMYKHHGSKLRLHASTFPSLRYLCFTSSGNASTIFSSRSFYEYDFVPVIVLRPVDVYADFNEFAKDLLNRLSQDYHLYVINYKPFSLDEFDFSSDAYIRGRAIEKKEGLEWNDCYFHEFKESCLD